MKPRMMMVCCVGLLLLIVLLPVTHAAVPHQINYQGYLTDSSGNPVLDGNYVMSFAIYDVATGGTWLWSESQTVTVTNGIYNVILGQPTNPIDPGIIKGDLYLGVQVGTDVEMTPRQKITSTAFTLKAAKAEDADTLDGKDSTQLDQSGHVSRTDNPHSVSAAQVGAATMSDITWGNLANKPSGFADNVDDTGIETETDPTVAPSVKDGVSWGELSGIPSGFADGVDNIGMTTSLDYGRSGVASNLYEGIETLSSRYINNDRAETMRASTSFHILSVIQDGTGPAISAESNGAIGIRSESYGANGSGVAGYSETSTGVFGQGGSKGVYGYTDGVNGAGVYGEATDSNGYGVYGQTEGRYGTGIYGKATGNDGVGVHGEASASGNVQNYGGYFVSNGAQSRAVYGKATYATLTNYGGYFVSESETGRGIFAVGGPNGYAAEFDGDVLISNANARLKTPILEITGGSDLSEQFNIHEASDKPSPGTVVSIDPDSPGDLTVSNKAYDRRVAGIISGAGGVSPGMMMGQKGSKADGKTPVAMTGRVYCLVDASKNPIEPGDLLTTSDTPGHAMKVTDYTRAQGAILGKAMSSLDKGQGLVLVLVTLQ